MIFARGRRSREEVQMDASFSILNNSPCLNSVSFGILQYFLNLLLISVAYSSWSLKKSLSCGQGVFELLTRRCPRALRQRKDSLECRRNLTNITCSETRYCHQTQNEETKELHISCERLELSDTMHGKPMQTGRPNGVRSSDWLDI